MVKSFAFTDVATFEENLAAFALEISAVNTQCGPILAAALPFASESNTLKETLLNELLAALNTKHPPHAVSESALPAHAPSLALAAASTPKAAAVRWFLEALEIEGFRGINNEGTPLSLKFKNDCVSSISAPNGVGKSSIYDALCFALGGSIPKLDRLLQSERAQDYYVNRFHPSKVGTITLTLCPDDGSKSVAITINHTNGGARKVVGPPGVDAEALLSDLNREFVLLDGQTFQEFINHKALDRGRAFSGLLGLSRYSVVRQQLQSLGNTRAFNAHFDVNGHAATKEATSRNILVTKASVAADFALLVGEPIAVWEPEQLRQRCHDALHAIHMLKSHCVGRQFMDIDINACVSAAGAVEIGSKREQLAKVIQSQVQWAAANVLTPAVADVVELRNLAAVRETALSDTSGELLLKLYRLSEQVISATDWPSPSLCPTCANDDGNSVLDELRGKLEKYNAVELSTANAQKEWTEKGWSELLGLESLTIYEDEEALLRTHIHLGESGTLSLAEVNRLGAHLVTLRQRAQDKAVAFAIERAQLEKDLPPSLVAVTTAVETARRLQRSWKTLEEAETEANAETFRSKHLASLKSFLDQVSAAFANAESAMAAARLKRIEPLYQELFKSIMYSPVVPALRKPAGSEELGIQLAEFWGLKDLSAQALLSESYRNAFAISVYLAAASLYGGTPRFIVLDDVTSSLDAGHQHHLVEVIRTRLARPGVTDGPQVILLSHDTMLEKLFNKHAGSAGWSHHRLEGTAKTAVLLQSGAANKVRDSAITLLQAGRVDDAAPRIRNFLEFTLHRVIDRCRIPVPIDLAFGDEKRTAGEYLNAITVAVALEKKAGNLGLDSTQVNALQLNSASIIGNYLSHWSTGQTQAFSASALLGVMQAIEDFPECFKYEPSPGVPKKFYKSLSCR